MSEVESIIAASVLLLVGMVSMLFSSDTYDKITQKHQMQDITTVRKGLVLRDGLTLITSFSIGIAAFVGMFILLWIY